jgi:uncharacterized protein YcfL
MKRKVCILFCSFFCSLLLASCEQDQTISATSEPSTVMETKLSSTNTKKVDLMLIQVDSSQFPQSQGVYDLHGEKLTIVKQYLPMTDNSGDDLDNPSAEIKQRIEADFKKNFAATNLQLEEDPFKIYETTFQGASFSIEGNRLYLRADGVELEFNYNEKTNRAFDENNVRYEVQVDQ